MPSTDTIPLSELIAHLRQELSQALIEGKSETTKFEIQEIGLELRNVPETTSLFSRNMLSSPPLGAKQGGGQHGRLCTGNRTEDEAAL